MVNVVTVSKEHGYLNIPDDLLIDAGDSERYPPDKIAVLCTGVKGAYGDFITISQLQASPYRDFAWRYRHYSLQGPYREMNGTLLT